MHQQAEPVSSAWIAQWRGVRPSSSTLNLISLPASSSSRGRCMPHIRDSKGLPQTTVYRSTLSSTAKRGTMSLFLTSYSKGSITLSAYSSGAKDCPSLRGEGSLVPERGISWSYSSSGRCAPSYTSFCSIYSTNNCWIMRQEELEILEDIELLEKNQIYLMGHPETPQQKLLHLFGHRHLLGEKMIHKNVDRCLDLLPGSFSQTQLQLCYADLFVNNTFSLPEVELPLLKLVQGWTKYLPTLRGQGKILLGEVVLQQEFTADDIQGYFLYLRYINIIASDLWKLIRRTGDDEEFIKDKPIREEVGEWRKTDLRHLSADDLLTFTSSCLPKTLLNILLEKHSLPAAMREKFSKFECLYSSLGVEFELRSSLKLLLLLKRIFLALFSLQLSAPQMRFLMLLSIRYYFVSHFQRRLSAAEVFIFAFNKISPEVRHDLLNEISLFVKILLKLGKAKFVDFLQQNSEFMKTIIQAMRKKPMIGYAQQSSSPYNSINIFEKIIVPRGASAYRYFQVLSPFSIFYYRIVVENMDITVKLHYLGQCGSQNATSTLLLTQQKKSGTLKNCINAMKKGIYMFQFDNSYSWINSKVISYQNIVFSPLEIKPQQEDEWISDYYLGISLTTVTTDIYRVPPFEKRKLVPATVKRNGAFASISLQLPASNYQYETDSMKRMLWKIQELLKEHKQLNFTIQNSSATFEEVMAYIKEEAPQSSHKQSRQIEYFREEDQPEEKPKGEEVVPRELDQTAITNEAEIDKADTGSSRPNPNLELYRDD